MKFVFLITTQNTNEQMDNINRRKFLPAGALNASAMAVAKTHRLSPGFIMNSAGTSCTTFVVGLMAGRRAGDLSLNIYSNKQR
ncbi:hypothetical protein ASG33_18415 [Dyadobacter sp. Leaf189]|nr:hypothetical protein ASG33_18415 [Dyadobacter sp. Leaf189]